MSQSFLHELIKHRPQLRFAELLLSNQLKVDSIEFLGQDHDTSGGVRQAVDPA